MANVAIEKVKENHIDSSRLISKLEALAERIRDRAYQIFQHREKGGNEVEDWLQAERDLVLAPDAELIEKNGKYEIRVAALGFRPEEISVTVFPDAIVVSAQSSHSHEQQDGEVHFCDFGQRALYRRLNVPEAIDVDKVSATLQDGVLRISAQKAQLALVKRLKTAA
jgi:HSP20 family protein